MSVSAGPNLHRMKPRVLVTGGCGFLGCNLADALASRGQSVLVLDNMSRTGAAENAAWLRQRHGRKVAIEAGDTRDDRAVRAAVRRCSAVLHLAAQVAVTTSVSNPSEDFEINARGTLNLLENLRRHNPSAPIIFASTNKVYGSLFGDEEVEREGERCMPADPRLRQGIDESAPLDFHSPYGCSKGAADQYVRDYARVFGLRSVVLRMSCIYGPRQFGNEDQGWLAHFLLQAIRGATIVIYGDGYQVRDALYVEDAVTAWLRALDRIDRVSGGVFNLGGGVSNAISLREMLRLIAELRGEQPAVTFAEPRPGDQPWYVSDTHRIAAALDWSPRTSLRDGVASLAGWLESRFGRVAAANQSLQEARA
jgi:CDP-paratose 2-epimerase